MDAYRIANNYTPNSGSPGFKVYKYIKKLIDENPKKVYAILAILVALYFGMIKIGMTLGDRRLGQKIDVDSRRRLLEKRKTRQRKLRGRTAV